MSGFAATLDRAAPGRAPSAQAALALADCDDLAALIEVAAALRDRGHGANVSYSRYGEAPAALVAASFDAPPLVDTPARRFAGRHYSIHDVK
jgi:hypothetical protein